MNFGDDCRERFHAMHLKEISERSLEEVNRNNMNDIRKLKSYVWHGEQCFFVSTLERDSSALVAPPPLRFNETIAWQYYWDTRERGDVVAQVANGPAFAQHTEVCRQLFADGKYIEGK